MNKIVLTLLATCIVYSSVAQTYKIVISYDENGNRIKRELVCDGCPGAQGTNEDSGNSTVAATDFSKKSLQEELFTFDVYPNPTTSLVTVKVDEKTAAALPQLQVLDASGRVLQHHGVTTTKTSIDFDEFADGSYYIALTVKGVVQRKKIVKLQ